MDTDKFFNRLVENALDFLARSIEELESSPKYSVIHFHAAVELFLKARLMADHWSLVVTKRQEPDWVKFVAGDFQSVSLDEAAQKLQKIVRSGLSNYELRAFREVTKHRNKMVHFFHEAHSEAQSKQLLQGIAKQQLNAWYLLNNLISVRWGSEFSSWTDQILEIDEKLREHHEFLQVIYDHLKDEIKDKINNGAVFESCPSCGFDSQEHQQDLDEVYEADCMVCGLVERYLKIKCPSCDEIVSFRGEGFARCTSCKKNLEPEDVVNLLIDEGEVYYAAKEGDDSWDLGNCSNCDGYHTVVRIDHDHYVCASCFEFFDSLRWCGWCNEPNTGDMEHSYVAGCNHCDGKAGWDND